MTGGIAEESRGRFPSPALIRYGMLFTITQGKQEIFRFDFSRQEGWKAAGHLLDLLEEYSGTLGVAVGENRRVGEGDAVVFLYFSHSNLSLSPGEGDAVYIAGIPDGGFQKELNPPLAHFLQGEWRRIRSLLLKVNCDRP